MSPEEVKADVDAAIDEFAQLIAQQEESSGIPRPPTIELSEVSFPPTEFDFGIEPQPTAETEAGDGGIVITYPRTGPCCFANGDCFIETQSECVVDGGTYQGDDGVCTPNPCTVAATGACCNGGICSITTRSACPGNYLGDGTNCVGVNCGTGACCDGSGCTQRVSGDCLSLTWGQYHGDGSTCAGIGNCMGCCFRCKAGGGTECVAMTFDACITGGAGCAFAGWGLGTCGNCSGSQGCSLPGNPCFSVSHCCG